MRAKGFVELIEIRYKRHPRRQNIIADRADSIIDAKQEMFRLAESLI